MFEAFKTALSVGGGCGLVAGTFAVINGTDPLDASQAHMMVFGSLAWVMCTFAHVVKCVRT